MLKYADTSNIQMPKNLPKIPFDINYHIYELDCELFTKCNLSCQFCFQNSKRNTHIDYDFILSIPLKAFSFIQQQIEFHKSNKIEIYSWGGQIFMDSLPDQIFNIYIKYMELFKQLICSKYPYIQLSFIWTSNGVFKKRKRVRNFLELTNSKIAFSYDPFGRYNTSSQMQLAIDNFYLFEDLMTCIGIVLNKNMIAQSVLDNDPILNSHFNIDINYYIGNTQYKKFLPSDEQLFQFYKWSLDNKKYNYNVIIMLLNNIYNRNDIPMKHCNCKYHAQFISGICTNKCSCNSNYPDEIFYGKYTKQMTEQNCTEIRNTLAIQTRNCLNCPHYSICPMYCNLSQIFKYYQMDICPLYQAIQYVLNTPSIKQSYFNYLNIK